ncbi:MAG: preprotein translocase subunit SecG [Verrucomicrobiota bacterium]
MDIFIYLITGVLVICCILLTGVVLIQRPRSEGLGSAFGGGMTESMFGAGTSDILTKATIWMAGFFFLCTLLLAILMSHKQTDKSSVLESALEVPAEPVAEQMESLEPDAVGNPTATQNADAPLPQATDSASAPAEAE